MKTYFAANQLSNKNEVKSQNNQNKLIEIVEEIEPKLKKKVKKNEFLIEFEDNPSYRFINLGGVQEVYEKINTELFNLIMKEEQYKQISRLPPNRGFLLSGSPGSGKTILANCILSYLVNYK